MNQRERKRLAKYRAGLILESALSDGWFPEDLVTKYGEEEVQKICTEISEIADKLTQSS